MALTLYVDVVNKKLLKTANGPVIESLPPFFYATSVDLLIYPRQPNPEFDRDNPYIEYDWTNFELSAEIGIADADASTTPAAVTTSFSDISAGKSGSLNLNTAGIAGLLLTKDSVQTYFEIRATPPALPADVVLQVQVELRGVVLDGAAIPPAAQPDYITRAEALAVLARKVGLPGQTIELVSPNGLYSVILGIRDDRTIQMDIIDN